MSASAGPRRQRGVRACWPAAATWCRRLHCLANDRNSAVAFELTADGYLLAMALDDAGRLLGGLSLPSAQPRYPSPTDVREALLGR